MNVTDPNQKCNKLVKSLKDKGVLFSEDESALSHLLMRKQSILKQQGKIINALHLRLKKVD